ncbi:MAG: dTMP kinase [Thermoplasmata archaeon]
MALFVTLEGIDGTGKTTLAGRLERRLRERGIDVVRTMEPTSSWVGEAVRRAVDEDADPRVQALLFLADRSLHTEEIEAWLADGLVVLCDRYHDSTLAYQGVALEGRVEDPRGWLERASEFLTLEPDLTLLLLLDPAEGLARKSTTRTRSPFERVAFLVKVQEAYQELAAGQPRFVKLDAALPNGELAKVAEGALLSRLQG